MRETKLPANYLLNALPKQEYERLLPKFERVALTVKKDVYQPGDVINHIYFPESGIISLLTCVEENSMLEVGIVGNECFVGLPVFMGVKTSNSYALVQGTGNAWRMTTADFLEECGQNGELPKILLRFVHSFIMQISQTAACNRYHSIESRLARWLLMTADRMKANEFSMTQEFLSNMLGVRREAVNIAATDFRERRLIDYNRGSLAILNRTKLETASCRCYEIVRRDFESFLETV